MPRFLNSLLALAVSRLFNCVIDDRLLDGLVDAILLVRFAPGAVDQRFDAAVFHRRLVAVKRVPRQAHDMARFRHVTQLFGQIQQSDLVLNHFLVSI